MNRLRPFSYFEPTSLDEVVQILSERGSSAVPFAGGTDLLVRMKLGQIKPAALVNLKRVPGLDGLSPADESASIGALTKVAALERAGLIREQYPALAQAAGVLGSPPIRSLATLGGNIGRASPASDLAPVLLVLGARAKISGPMGERAIAVADVFAGPGCTSLAPGEVISSFELPARAENSGQAYLKIGRREGMDCALVGVAAFVRLAGDGAAAEARLAFSSVGPTPLRAPRAEELVIAGPLNSQRLAEAAQIASDEITPMSDMRASEAYRRQAARALTFRALTAACEMARGGCAK